jgi:hypothetical protein
MFKEETLEFELGPGKPRKILFQEQNKNKKRAGWLVQVVKYLPSKCEDLDSIPRSQEKKKENYTPYLDHNSVPVNKVLKPCFCVPSHSKRI